MGVLDNIKDKVKQIFNFNKSTADFFTIYSYWKL